LLKGTQNIFHGQVINIKKIIPISKNRPASRGEYDGPALLSRVNISVEPKR
jgi:hypothetical protein